MKPSEYIRQGWCQGAVARNATGVPCQPTHRDATAWCLYGAINKTYPEDTEQRTRIMDRIRHILRAQRFIHVDDPASLALWNDHPKRTQQEVIQLLQQVGE